MRQEELKPIFDTLEQAFTTLGIDYYLIGALARQVWYQRADLRFRTTKDIDYAALIGSYEEYEQVKQHLIENAHFTASKENAFVLIAPDGTQVDILPFGEIEEDGVTRVNGIGLTSIRVDGMKEVYETGTEKIELQTGHTFQVATLSAIALLKFIAYDDRPEFRQKDVTDITNLILNFSTLQQDLIWDFHHDLFNEDDPDLMKIGANVIGREMRKITDANIELTKRLEAILEKHIDLKEKSSFIRLMVREAQSDVRTMIAYLDNILWGFNNKSTV